MKPSVLLGVLSTLLVGAVSANAALPTFPGAEGFGAASVGGRGGKVIHVTNLNSSGAGSLNAALAASGPRIVVFDVSGVISGDQVIRNSNVTIAGQTAPGAGITISGRLMNVWQNPDAPAYPKWPSLHDITVQHIRVRAPAPAGSNGDCIQLTDVDRLMIDHVATSWGSDENIDMCSSRDVTVQWTTIEESDGRRTASGAEDFSHNFGMIVGYAGKNITIHHNLFANHSIRAPLIGVQPVDHRNNVIYNVRDGVVWEPIRMNRAALNTPFKANIVGNYFKEGPNFHRDPAGKIYANPAVQNSRASIYTNGATNYFAWVGGYKLTRFPGVFEVIPTLTKPYVVPAVTTDTAEKAYGLVLNYAGAFPRDAVTKSNVAGTRDGTGRWGRHAPAGGLLAGLTPGTALKDTDKDGMPDTWETAHNLNPSVADGNKIVPVGASANNRFAGYTYIEFYIGELSEKLVGTSTGVPTPPPAVGDVNLDGMVDIGDLAILGAHYNLKTGATWAIGDMNGDGAVDLADLALLAGNYGFNTTKPTAP